MEHSKRIAQFRRVFNTVATSAATLLLAGDHSRALMFRREIDCLIVLGTSLLSACIANGPSSAENLMQPTQVDLRVINGGDSSIIPTESQINVHNNFMSAESEGKLTFFNNQGESVEGNLIDFASNFLNPAEITSDVILTDVPPSLITFGETPIALQAVGFQAINPDTNQPMIKYSVFAQVGDQGPWTLLVTPENPDDESIGFSQVAGGVAVTKPINLIYLFNNEEPIPQPWIITGQNGQPFIAVIRPNRDGHGEFISANKRLVADDIAHDMSTPEARALARRAMAKIALPTMTPVTVPDDKDPTATLEATITPDFSLYSQEQKIEYVQNLVNSLKNSLSYFASGNFANIPDQDGNGQITQEDIATYQQKMSETVFHDTYSQILQVGGYSQEQINAMTPDQLQFNALEVANGFDIVAPLDLKVAGDEAAGPQAASYTAQDGTRYDGIYASLQLQEAADKMVIESAGKADQLNSNIFGIDRLIQRLNPYMNVINGGKIAVSEISEGKYAVVIYYQNHGDHYLPLRVFFADETLYFEISGVSGHNLIVPIDPPRIITPSSTSGARFFEFTSPQDLIRSIRDNQGGSTVDSVIDDVKRGIDSSGLEVAGTFPSLEAPPTPASTPTP